MMGDPRPAKVFCASVQSSNTFNVRSPNQSDVQLNAVHPDVFFLIHKV